MQLRSIQSKIALIGGICLLATAGSLVTYGVYSASATQQLVTTRASTSSQEVALNALTNLGG